MKNSLERQVKIIVAIGDIQGFGSYTLRITKPESEYLPFMNYFDGLVGNLHRDCRIVKETGDGFILFHEIQENNGHLVAINLLKDMKHVSDLMNDRISDLPWPRPDGFRVRLATGYVWKKTPIGNSPIFRGYHINLASKILRIRKDIPLICHESFKYLIQSNKSKPNGYSFHRINTEEESPDGIYSRDVKDLWEIKIK